MVAAQGGLAINICLTPFWIISRDCLSLFINYAVGNFLARQSQMNVVWWFQISEFVGSMAEKWPLPEGLGLKSPIAVLSTIYLDGSK